MCHPVLCRVCSKVTWTGCGEHVEQALAGIPDEHLCTGHGRPAAVPAPAPGPGPGPATRG